MSGIEPLPRAESWIAGRTLREWEEFARRDDCLDLMVPSDWQGWTERSSKRRAE